ncbi:unnamed protein product [Rhodiola kirilowii]
MPRKTPRQKKQVQVSDEDTPDQRRTLRRVQNKARQLRAQNRNFTTLNMNQNPALLNGLVQDDQQRPAQHPARRTLRDYTAPCLRIPIGRCTTGCGQQQLGDQNRTH